MVQNELIGNPTASANQLSNYCVQTHGGGVVGLVVETMGTSAHELICRS
jgi:hypothetical protein